MDTHAHKERALQHLANFLSLLKAQPDQPRVAPLVQLTEQLQSAVTAFHMEAIRFRMFTLGRHLQDPANGLPPDAHALYDAVQHALEAAGFHTRSVPH